MIRILTPLSYLLKLLFFSVCVILLFFKCGIFDIAYIRYIYKPIDCAAYSITFSSVVIFIADLRSASTILILVIIDIYLLLFSKVSL